MPKKHPYENCGYKYWFFGLGETYTERKPDQFYFAAFLRHFSLIAYTRSGAAGALYLFNRAVFFWVGEKWKFGNLQKGVR